METATLPTIDECKAVISNPDNRIGGGRHRWGYHVEGSRWVFKVEKARGKGINADEFTRYEEILGSGKMPAYINLPEMHMLENGVIASEYIDGGAPSYCFWKIHEAHELPESCWRRAVEDFGDLFGLDDSSASCNVRVTADGKVYVIDLGE